MPTRTELLEITLTKIQKKNALLQESSRFDPIIANIDFEIQTLGRLYQSRPMLGTSDRLLELGREKTKMLARRADITQRLEHARKRFEDLRNERLRTTLSPENSAKSAELLILQEAGVFDGVDAVSIFLNEVESPPTKDAPFERFYRAITDPESVKAEAKARLVTSKRERVIAQPSDEPERRQTRLAIFLSLLESATTPITIEQMYTHVWGGEYSPEKAGMVYNLVSAARRSGLSIERSNNGYYKKVVEPDTRKTAPDEEAAAKRSPILRSSRENTHPNRIFQALSEGPLTVVAVYKILNPDFKGDELDRAQMQRAYRTLHELREKLPIGFRVVLIDGKYNLEYPLGLTPDSVDILACALQANLMMFTKLVEGLAPAEPPLTVVSNLASECLARGTTLDVSTTSQIEHRKDLLKRREALFKRIGQILGGEMGNAVTQLENSNPQLLVLLNYLAQLNRIRVRFPSHPDVNGEITTYDLLSEICINDGPNIFKGRVPLRSLAVAPYTEPEQQAQTALTTTIVNFVDRLPMPVKPLAAAGVVVTATQSPEPLRAAPLDVDIPPTEIRKHKKPRHPKPVRLDTPPKERSKPEFGSEDYCRPFIIAEIKFLLTKKDTILSTDQLFNPSQIVKMVGKRATRSTLDPALEYVKPMEKRSTVPYYNAVGVITALVILRNRNLSSQSLSRIQGWVEVILTEIENGKLEIS